MFIHVNITVVVNECSVNDKKQEIYPTNKLTRKEIGIDNNYKIFYVIAGYHTTLIVMQQ